MESRESFNLPDFNISFTEKGMIEIQLAKQLQLWIESEGNNSQILKIITALLYMFLSDKGISANDLTKLLEEDSVYLFNTIEEKTRNIFLLARIFDVLWIRKQLGGETFRAGEKAVSYYLQCVDRCIKENDFFDAGNYFKRYFYLSSSLGKNHSAYNNSRKELLKRIRTKLTSNNEYYLRSLYQLYEECSFTQKQSDNISKFIISGCEKYLSKIPVDCEHIVLFEIYFKLLLNIYKQRKDFENATRILLRWKDTYITIANNNKRASFKIYYLQKSIEVLRQIERADYRSEIDGILMEIQMLKNHVDKELSQISFGPIDVSKIVEQSITMIKGKTLEEALLILADNMFWLSEKNIPVQNKPQLLDFLPVIYYDINGQEKNTFKRPLVQQLYINLHYLINFMAARIEPMLDIIRQEHFFTQETFLPLLVNQPFVPPGHEKLYSKGLYYYLIGEYAEAASILIPQFENSLRHFISVRTPTFYVSRPHVDMYKTDIDELITIAVKDQRLDPIIGFSAQYFFGKNDANLRNNVAHGLLGYEEITSPIMVAGLSLIYWFIMYPFRWKDRDE